MLDKSGIYPRYIWDISGMYPGYIYILDKFWIYPKYISEYILNISGIYSQIYLEFQGWGVQVQGFQNILTFTESFQKLLQNEMNFLSPCVLKVSSLPKKKTSKIHI
jgi:hypothetical protein